MFGAEDAEYVLCPVSANLQLAHEPANNILHLYCISSNACVKGDSGMMFLICCCQVNPIIFEIIGTEGW